MVVKNLLIKIFVNCKLLFVFLNNIDILNLLIFKSIEDYFYKHKNTILLLFLI